MDSLTQWEDLKREATNIDTSRGFMEALAEVYILEGCKVCGLPLGWH
jgi:hypothetical protein